jgi:hypothetical protein
VSGGEKVSGTFFLKSAKSEETLADQGRPRNPSITWCLPPGSPSPGSPARAQQKIVAPGLSPARGYVAASSPRHGGVPMGSGQVPPPLPYAALNGEGEKVSVPDTISPADGTGSDESDGLCHSFRSPWGLFQAGQSR